MTLKEILPTLFEEHAHGEHHGTLTAGQVFESVLKGTATPRPHNFSKGEEHCELGGYVGWVFLGWIVSDSGFRVLKLSISPLFITFLNIYLQYFRDDITV